MTLNDLYNKLFYADRISLLVSYLSEIFIQIGYFF